MACLIRHDTAGGGIEGNWMQHREPGRPRTSGVLGEWLRRMQRAAGSSHRLEGVK
jgi:hypothetical protein